MTERMANIVNALIAARPMMFRNDCGVAYVGGREYIDHMGKLHVIEPKRIHYGLHKGSGDYIGWDAGRFVSVEIKLHGDKLSDDQRTWNRIVRLDGCIAEVWAEQADGTIKILTGEAIE